MALAQGLSAFVHGSSGQGLMQKPALPGICKEVYLAPKNEKKFLK